MSMTAHRILRAVQQLLDIVFISKIRYYCNFNLIWNVSRDAILISGDLIRTPDSLVGKACINLIMISWKVTGFLSFLMPKMLWMIVLTFMTFATNVHFLQAAKFNIFSDFFSDQLI